MKSLGNAMAKGAAWMVLFKLSERSVGLVSTVILARILVPADFGLVAMATSIIAVLQLLGAFSFDMALIQNAAAERRHYDTAWTFNLLFSLGCAVVLVALAGAAASFYDEPRLAAVMRVLALGTLVQGFENVGVVAFRKELEFHKEFRFLFAKKIAGFVVTVSCALALRTYWALVAGMVASSFAGVVLSYVWQPYRPRWSLAARADLLHFSRWLLVNNALGFFYHRATDFILAKGVGSQGLGYYSVAYEIANLPTTEIVAPVNRAVFPGYAKLSRNLADMRAGFISVISILALLATPAAVGLASVADPLVRVVLGDKWLDTIALIQVLAVHGLLGAIMGCCGYVYIAMGRPTGVTIALASHIAIAAPLATWAAFHLSIYEVAWALLTASVLVIPVNCVLLVKMLRVTMSELAGALWRPVAASALMAIVVNTAHAAMGADTGFATHLVELFELVVLGAVTYCAAIVALWRLCSKPPGAEELLMRKIKGALLGAADAGQ